MPYPAISTLPVSPSRLGDPNNFITESLAFLDAQIDLFDVLKFRNILKKVT